MGDYFFGVVLPLDLVVAPPLDFVPVVPPDFEVLPEDVLPDVVDELGLEVVPPVVVVVPPEEVDVVPPEVAPPVDEVVGPEDVVVLFVTEEVDVVVFPLVVALLPAFVPVPVVPVSVVEVVVLADDVPVAVLPDDVLVLVLLVGAGVLAAVALPLGEGVAVLAAVVLPVALLLDDGVGVREVPELVLVVVVLRSDAAWAS